MRCLSVFLCAYSNLVFILFYGLCVVLCDFVVLLLFGVLFYFWWFLCCFGVLQFGTSCHFGVVVACLRVLLLLIRLDTCWGL